MGIHDFCRTLATDAAREPKAPRVDYVIALHSSQYEVAFKNGRRRQVRGCCKWSARFKALMAEHQIHKEP